MIKRLINLTEEEYIKWWNKNCNKTTFCRQCLFYNVQCYPKSTDIWTDHKDLYSDKFLNQTIEIEDESILNEEEKAYLSVVIKPFDVKKIRKYLDYRYKVEILTFFYLVKGEDCEWSTYLPAFPKGTMFKGMENGKCYTPEELGLQKEEEDE